MLKFRATWLGVGLVIRGWMVQFPAGALWSVVWQKVNSILLQSTQLQNGYLAQIRHRLERVRYMLPVALEYPRGIEMVSVCTVPARRGRSCEHFGGYKTINRITLPLTNSRDFQSPICKSIYVSANMINISNLRCPILGLETGRSPFYSRKKHNSLQKFHSHGVPIPAI